MIISTVKSNIIFNSTYQLLAVSLSLLSAPDLHVDLVASMFEFDLQGSPLGLRFGENLFARAQFLLGPQPFATALIKVLCHLDEVCHRWCTYINNVTGHRYRKTKGIRLKWWIIKIKPRTINYSLGSMFSLRRSTCILSLSYKPWRLSTAVSMMSYRSRPFKKQNKTTKNIHYIYLIHMLKFFKQLELWLLFKLK